MDMTEPELHVVQWRTGILALALWFLHSKGMQVYYHFSER